MKKDNEGGGMSIADIERMENVIGMQMDMHIIPLRQQIDELSKIALKAKEQSDINSASLAEMKKSLARQKETVEDTCKSVTKNTEDMEPLLNDYRAWKANKRFVAWMFAGLGALIATTAGLISLISTVVAWVQKVPPGPPT